MAKRHQQHLFAEQDPVPAVWEQAAARDQMTARLVFNRPLTTEFSYLVPEGLHDLIQPGQRVRAPFGRGNRMTTGFCVALGTAGRVPRKLKTLDAILDREPLLSHSMLELTHWIADRYLCGWGQVLQGVIPAGVKNKSGTRLITLFEPAPAADRPVDELKLPTKQRAVLIALQRAGRALSIAEVTELADCGTGPVQALRNKGLIRAIRERRSRFEADAGAVATTPDLTLNADQQGALSAIVDVLEAQAHRTILLHGVTGSGKTEVYIQAIREVVSYGRQAIVLVPEISLTPQTIRRFRSRFDSVAVLHSHLTDSQRHWHWQQIARGAMQVVVGARSAVFAPTPHLGIIVIDEEHETTFKQDTTPRYHAREVARRRAEIERIPLVLGSATPTLESWLRVTRGQDTLVSLPTRVKRRPLPPVVIVDVRNDPRIANGSAIGRALHTAMQSTLAANGQVLLFLNVRGFSPTLWCRSCGEPVKCPECDITLTWHKDRNVALCHLCDYAAPPPAQCPNCGQPGVRYFGIGTQKLEQEVRNLFRDHPLVRMDSDSMKAPGSHDDALEAFRRGEVQVLLGTQMIAKGLDFPNVTLVGVIDADTVLHQPDVRSAERTFGLLAQVAGRTGRGDRGGRVLVQTCHPEEPSIVLAARHDYLGFARFELEQRHQMNAPPFTHIVRVILRGPHESTVDHTARKFAQVLRECSAELKSDVLILGPAPAPVTRLRNHFRFHLQIAGSTIDSLQTLWHAAEPGFPAVSDVEYTVDMDAINMR